MFCCQLIQLKKDNGNQKAIERRKEAARVKRLEAERMQMAQNALRKEKEKLEEGLKKNKIKGKFIKCYIK